jgi:hypothetical protein
VLDYKGRIIGHFHSGGYIEVTKIKAQGGCYYVTVYHITRPEYGGVGDVVFHGLSQSYFVNGGGFSTFCAGLNTASGRRDEGAELAAITARREAVKSPTTQNYTLAG